MISLNFDERGHNMLYLMGIMWFAFGIGSIIAAALNIIWAIKGKDAKWFRFTSLSFTALTLCSFYSQASVWVLHEDWSALQDVVPSVSAVLWILTLTSIALNSISLLKTKKK